MISNNETTETDVLVIGAGLAGCVTALTLAEKGVEVTLLSSRLDPLQSSTYYAQGGIIYKGNDDSIEKLSDDVIRAGAGLSNKKSVQFLAKEGPRCVEELLINKLNIDFDRNEEGDLALTQEGAHSLYRIIHSKDHTGRSIMGPLFEAVTRHPKIKLLTSRLAIDLITLDHHSKNYADHYEPLTCAGAYVFNSKTQQVETFLAKETVLATGGVGELFLHTTNPEGSRGDGVAMAARAGVRVMHMEYIQFHPTAIYIPNERRFLLSEALRGEGARLLTIEGQPFMQQYHALGDLAPRDVVSRAIYSELLKSSCDHVYLDITSKSKSWLQNRFPTIYAHCEKLGFDMAKDYIPVVPAAHYLCGGIVVDFEGRTSMRRLRAVGETACTGVHGANRLASTSLLECLVWGESAALSIEKSLKEDHFKLPEVDPWMMSLQPVDVSLIQQDWLSIRQTMWNYVGLVRDRTRLLRAWAMLRELQWQIQSFYENARLTSELIGLHHGIETALLITRSAMQNRHSRGCHFLSH